MIIRKKQLLTLALSVLLPAVIFCQHHHEEEPVNIEPQPLLAQALRLREALSFLGSPLSPADDKALVNLKNQALSQETVSQIQKLFDPYCLALVNINPEARVKVERGQAPAKLTQNGWTTFLVKVNNDAGVNAQLQVQSPNTVLPMHPSNQQPEVKKEDIISRGLSENRFLDIKMYRNKPLLPNLSGLKLEYQVVQIYSSDAGKREAEFSFNIGQGSQDIGFRNATNILFNIQHAVKVQLTIKDDDGSPAMASFFITDSIAREPGKFAAYYPLPSRRVAAFDEYPDFFFQRQIYRNDGETVMLPPGKYHVEYSRGPEYIPMQRELIVPANTDSINESFTLKRWIHMSKLVGTALITMCMAQDVVTTIVRKKACRPHP